LGSEDKDLAVSNGKQAGRWICNVQHHSKRASWAFKENRDYVTKILDKWAPVYQKGVLYENANTACHRFCLGELFEKYRVQVIEFAKKLFKKNEVSNEPKS